MENFTATSYLEIIDKLIVFLYITNIEFSSIFEDFAALEPVLRFFINPFSVTEDDVLEIVSVYFERHNIEDLELEILNLQSDIILKAHSNDKMFWNLVDENKYPILSAKNLFILCNSIQLRVLVLKYEIFEIKIPNKA